jgi:hypothetical protein
MKPKYDRQRIQQLLSTGMPPIEISRETGASKAVISRINTAMLTHENAGRYPIEKGIPIPPIQKPYLHPWEDMEVGDSFFVPFSIEKLRKVARSVGARQRHSSHRYAIRTLLDGVRVWRIE